MAHQYFAGVRQTAFNFTIKGVDCHCIVLDHWIDTQQSTTCHCGGKTTVTTRITRGISSRDSQSFKDSVESTLGNAAIASVKAKIEESLQTTISWDESVTLERTIEICAPRCGRRTEIIYQHVRDFKFCFSQPRVFRSAKRWERSIREFTEDIDYVPDIEDTPSHCPDCPDGSYPSIAGYLSARIRNIFARIPFAEGVEGYELRLDNWVQPIQDALPATIEVDAEVLPAIIKFLAGVNQGTVEVSLDRDKSPFGRAMEVLEAKMTSTTPAIPSGYGGVRVIEEGLVIPSSRSEPADDQTNAQNEAQAEELKSS